MTTPPVTVVAAPAQAAALGPTERLTRRWGLTREDSNTRVWFEFDFSGAVPAAA